MQRITDFRKIAFIIFIFALCLIPVVLNFMNRKQESGEKNRSTKTAAEVSLYDIKELPMPPASDSEGEPAQPCGYCSAPIEEFMATEVLLRDMSPELQGTQVSFLQKGCDPVMGGFFVSDDDFRKSLVKTAWEINAFAELAKKDQSLADELTKLIDLNVSYIQRVLADKESGGFFAGQAADMLLNGKLLTGEDYYRMEEADRIATGMPSIIRNIPSEGNALVIKSLLNAADLLDKPEWRDTAEKAAATFLSEITGGVSAKTVQGILLAVDMYQSDGDNRWLETASVLADKLIEGGVFDNPLLSDGLKDEIVNVCECNPDYRPAAALVLNRLYHLTNKPDFDKAVKDFTKENEVSGPLAKLIDGYPLSIAIVGPADDSATKELRRQARNFFEPNKTIITLDPVRDAVRLDELPYHAHPEPTMYACVDAACSMPVSDPEKVRTHLQKFVDRYLYKKDSGLKKFKLE